MSEVRDAAEELVEENPGLREGLESVLEVDRHNAEWRFDDVPLDSGVFGELVDRGVVEKVGEGYRVADHEAVRAALEGREADKQGGGGGYQLSFATPSVYIYTVSLMGVLVVGGALRSYIYPSVFREGDVVLLSNDPYFYRYLVETLVMSMQGPLDLSAFVGMPGGNGAPLTAALLGTASELLGIPGVVLALYPVVAAAATILVAYLLAKELTGSSEFAVVAALFLAVTPIYAARTALGFADHHALDYFWLAVTLHALVKTTREGYVFSGNRSWRHPLYLGVAVTGLLLSWQGGLLLAAPIAVYLAVAVVLDVYHGWSPLRMRGGVVLGLAVPAAVLPVLHYVLGWYSGFVPFAPMVLFLTASGLVAAAELIHRKGWSAVAVVGAEATGVAAVLVVFPAVVPGFGGLLSRGLEYFTRTFRTSVESFPLFYGGLPFASGGAGFLSGPISLFGALFFLALIGLVWVSVKGYRDTGWLAASVYAWYFLGFALFQRRFAGEYALFAALYATTALLLAASLAGFVDLEEFFGGAGFSRVHPRFGTISLIAVLVVAGVTAGAAPTKVEQTVIPPDLHDAAQWIDGYAEQEGIRYPDNYVFSRWGYNRMFNYFVSGLEHPSLDYSYARSNYLDFVESQSPEEWYRRLSEERVGFVVMHKLNTAGNPPPDSMYARLHRYGTRFGNSQGVGNYRLVYAAPDGYPKVYRLVPGATLTGKASSSVDVSTRVNVPGASFTYERRVLTSNSTYNVTVPYPGTYRVNGESVVVNESVVRNGGTIHIDP